MKDNNTQVLPLDQAADVNLVGGKAINLAKLLQAGFPVPGGFVITTHAYRAAHDGHVSDELAVAIRLALKPFANKRLAVRSSATAEDMSGASMAGQYDTFLNLETAEQVLQAVEKCWSSVRSQRTEAYLAEHGIDIEDVAMAVVVQQQVSADAAGVLFTVDPQTGSRENMLIEASWGLGEALVSGEVQPDVIRVSCAAPEVLSYEVADKQLAMYPGGEGFQAVPADQRQRACLTFPQIERLRALGRLAEKHFGGPQDIEWAVEAGEVYMLQTRAITTLAETDTYHRLLRETRAYLGERAEHSGGPWVRHNLGETLPHPTPLTWSIMAPFMSGTGGFGKMHEMLGFTPGPAVADRSFLERIGGEIYMDCALMTEMFAAGYPFAYDPQELRDNPDAAQNPPTLPTGGLKEIGAAAKLAQQAAASIDDLATTLDREFDETFVPKVLKWVSEQQAMELDALSDSALSELWQSQSHQVLNEFGAMAFLPSMVEAVAVETLRQALNEHVWDEDGDMLLATLSVSAIPDRTTAGNMDLQTLDPEQWLASYGHRATAEFELASPRWHEQPDIVTRLKSQLDGSDLSGIHQQRQADADACLTRLQAKLAASDFEQIAAASQTVQRYLRFREDGKFYLIRAYSELRRTALEIGKRLKVGDGIFYLTADEMLAALHSGFVPEDRIATRQLEYTVEQRIQTPHLIEAVDLPNLGQAIVRADGPALKAHSVSNGSAQGPACIILDPSQSDAFTAGSILVCPSTDPSWTPLFAKASGLVLERGGSLSHGAVVAREMGLPAVVLDGATELLQAGEPLTIDANAGWIYRAGADAAAEDTAIPHDLVPPTAGTKEVKANRLGLIAAVAWAVLLAAIFLLPPQVLHDPFFALLDWLFWPLIRSCGMVGAVAIIAGFFGLAPVLGQKYLTDNARLFEAKRRSGLLRKAAAKLPADSERRKQMDALAAPVTMRILKASMVPLALILGPMIMVFMWFPARVDPASWNAEPGRMVSIVAEVDGECLLPVELSIPAPLTFNSQAQQTLPNLRQELEALRQEWSQSSDLSAFPWSVQSAADQTRITMLSSLNSYLKTGIPAQKMSWLIDVPAEATGSFPVALKVDGETVSAFELVFGSSVPPQPAAFAEVSEQVLSLQINYPRALQQHHFFNLPGTQKDIGWLGIYLLLYLPLMFVSKYCLRVP